MAKVISQTRMTGLMLVTVATYCKAREDGFAAIGPAVRNIFTLLYQPGLILNVVLSQVNAATRVIMARCMLGVR